MEMNMQKQVEKNNPLSPDEQSGFETAERTRVRGRKSLDRFLEGWIVREVLDTNGNVRRERVYIGDYYKSEESKSARILRKIGYLLLYAASIALFALAAVQQTGANIKGYVALTQGLVVLAMIWVLNGMFSYLTAPAEMTVADYKGGSLSLKKSSFVLALSFALPALTTLIHLFADSADRGRELLCVLGYLAAGGLMLLVWLMEKKLVYNSRPSPEKQWTQDRPEEA